VEPGLSSVSDDTATVWPTPGAYRIAFLDQVRLMGEKTLIAKTVWIVNPLSKSFDIEFLFKLNLINYS